MSVINEAEADEVLQFLTPGARTDLKAIAMQYFLGLTGSEEGRLYVHSDTKYLAAIVDLTQDEQSAIAKDAYLAMVNLATEAAIARQLLALKREPNLGVELLSYVLKTTSEHADIACALLNNLSRLEDCAGKFVELMVSKQTEIGFDKVVQAFSQAKYNPRNQLHYLGPFLANLTQIQDARKYVLDRERCVIQRLLPYTEYRDSLTRRGGVISILHNCCFETGESSALSHFIGIRGGILWWPEVLQSENNAANVVASVLLACMTSPETIAPWTTVRHHRNLCKAYMCYCCCLGHCSIPWLVARWAGEPATTAAAAFSRTWGIWGGWHGETSGGSAVSTAWQGERKWPRSQTYVDRVHKPGQYGHRELVTERMKLGL